MSTTECFYCTGTGAIEVNDDFERTCGHCGGTGLDGNTLRDAAPDLLEALRDLVARCDGPECLNLTLCRWCHGVRADGGNIETLAAHVAIAKAEGGN